jgi:hypothetical protein
MWLSSTPGKNPTKTIPTSLWIKLPGRYRNKETVLQREDP